MLIDPEGIEWGPYRRLATSLDSVNIKTINYGLEQPPPFKKVTSWDFECYLYFQLLINLKPTS